MCGKRVGNALSIASSKLGTRNGVGRDPEMDSVAKTYAFGLTVGSPMMCYEEPGGLTEMWAKGNRKIEGRVEGNAMVREVGGQGHGEQEQGEY